MNRFHTAITALFCFVALLNSIAVSAADRDSTNQAAVEESVLATVPSLPSDEAKATLQWAVYLIQANLPPQHTGKKNWGATKRFYTGIDIDHDGMKLKTHRTFREVRHGKWLRYTIDLKDPNDPRYLNIEVARAVTSDDGRLHVDLTIDTQVDIETRQERWSYGLQLYSISTKSTAKLRMTVAANIGFVFDYTRIPPDIVFDPVIENAELKIIDLEVDRISKLGSDIAEELGDFAEHILRDEYLPNLNQKLVSKLNSQINRRRDKLRISASDWLSKQLSWK